MSTTLMSNKVLNYLNDKYNVNNTIIKDIISLKLVDNDFYRVECNIIEIFPTCSINDISIYFIDRKELRMSKN